VGAGLGAVWLGAYVGGEGRCSFLKKRTKRLCRFQAGASGEMAIRYHGAGAIRAALCALVVAVCARAFPAATSTVEPACIFPRPTPSANDMEFPRLTYLHVGTEAVKLDLYVPKMPAHPPLIVQIHGGGWHSGSGAQPLMAYNARVLAGQGFAVASLDYRLVKDGTNQFPAAVQDVRCAVRWLKAEAHSYGYDAADIGALGFSAGANLAAILGTAALTGGDFDSPSCAVKDQSPSIRSVAAFYGPMNLADTAGQSPKVAELISHYLGRAPSADLPLAKRASPITYVNPRATPFFLVHGRRDNLVTVAQQTDFLAALRQAGVHAEDIELPTLGHAFDPFDTHLQDQVQPTTCALLNFFHSTLSD
jgi:acetyl esterase/lipase